MRRLAVKLLLVLAVITPAYGAAADPAPDRDPEPDPVASALRDLTRQGFPAALGYLRDGRTARAYAAGVADTATGEPATTRHRFRIASSTKAFTATVLLQLAGEGRLSLDDAVARWLPGVLSGNGYRPGRITIRQLLGHTSGVHDPATTPAFFAPYLEEGDRDHVIWPREVIRRAVAHGPDFAPGSEVGYSNTNYLLAGLIIERVTGHRAETEIARRVLAPLGLRDTTLPRADPHVHGPHLHGYDLDGRDMTVFSPSYDWTAGAMISTVHDLSRFQRALFDGRLLRPEQQRELREVTWDGDSQGYGLGVEVLRMPCPDGCELELWGTTGAGPGYYSYALTTADGDRQLTVATTVYDLAAELGGTGQAPWPVPPLTPLTAAFCEGRTG
jgi:D-alanyl-D-alanine carboxypeptidase